MQELAAANAEADTDASKEASWKQTSGEEPPHLASKISEVARFGALKEKKHSLEAGIALFNRYVCPQCGSTIAARLFELLRPSMRLAKACFPACLAQA